MQSWIFPNLTSNFFLHQLINKGKGEALRIRAILRSLVPTEDLVGIISIPLKMPIANKGTCQRYAVQQQPPEARVGEQRLLKSKHNGYRFQFSAHNFLISNTLLLRTPTSPDEPDPFCNELSRCID